MIGRGRGVERGKGRERRRKSSQGLAKFIGVPRSWRPPDRILIFLARSGKNLFRYSTWAHSNYSEAVCLAVRTLLLLQSLYIYNY